MRRRWGRAEIVAIERDGNGCVRFGGQRVVPRIYADGAELLKEAEIGRFELEPQGWSDKRTANTTRVGAHGAVGSASGSTKKQAVRGQR